MKRPMMFATLIACVAATAWAGLGSASPSKADKAAAGSSTHHLEQQGRTWSCGFNPYNPSVSFLSFGPVYEPLVFVDTLNNEETTIPGHRLQVGQRQQDPDLHHPRRREVERRKAVDGRRRRLHVQPAEDQPRPRRQRALVGAEERHAGAATRSTVSFRRPGRAVLLLRRRPHADRRRSTSGARGRKDPVKYQDADARSAPGLHRSSRAARTTSPTPRTRATGSPACRRSRRSTTPPTPTTRRPTTTSHRARRSRAASSSRASTSPTSQETSRTTTTGSRRRQRRALLQPEAPDHRTSRSARRWRYAIDRDQVSKIGECGYQPAANQSGIVTPTFNSWIDKGAGGQDHVQPGQGEVDPRQGRLQDVAAASTTRRRASAVAHDHQYQRLHRLGRVCPDQSSS